MNEENSVVNEDFMFNTTKSVSIETSGQANITGLQLFSSCFSNTSKHAGFFYLFIFCAEPLYSLMDRLRLT